jgi:hypothetical protein
MSLKQNLIMGEDIEEKISWGVDISTAVTLMDLMPSDINQAYKSKYIE